MKSAASRPRVAILGCGHVGRALALELLGSRRSGIDGALRVWSRSRRTREALRRRVVEADRRNARRLRVIAGAAEAFADADLVLLCVSDEGIPPLIRELSESPEAFHGQVVLVTNGYLPLTPLAPLRRRGCAIGRLHPLAPVPAGLEHIALTMAHFGIEGDARAVRAASRLAKAIDGDALFLTRRRGAAQAYHAGASLLGGGLIALFHLTEQTMRASVTSRADLRQGLANFAESILTNAMILGPEKALTGALSRGSEALVRGHLAELRKVPAALELYRLLGGTMLELGRARGSIDAAAHRRLDALLESFVRKKSERIGRMRPRDWRRLPSDV